MEEMRKDIRIIRDCQIKMTEDLRHHIKRSDVHELKITPLWTAYIGARWTIGAILTSSAILYAIMRFKGVL